MGRISREEKEKQARQSLLRRERQVKKLQQEEVELAKQRREIAIRLKKAHQKAREAKAQLILTLPPGAKVHYGAYLCDAKWAWIGERTGTVVKTGRKCILVDYGDRGKVWVHAVDLREGEGNRGEAQAKVAGEIERVLGGME